MFVVCAQVMEWERRIRLQREMALALDPTLGNAEAAALVAEVGRLRYECARLYCTFNPI